MNYRNSDDCLGQLAGTEAIDYFVAVKLCGHFNCDNNDLFHLFLALQWLQRQGHGCLPLSAVAGHRYWNDQDALQPGFTFPAEEVLREALSALPLDVAAQQPLVFEDDRLYLRRYWQFEEEVANSLKRRLEFTGLPDAQAEALPPLLTKMFATYSKATDGTDWQQVAVANAAGRRFSIISGGPGTGKTYTVARLLAAAQTAGKTPLRILMAAPTGKAAQRLKESIGTARVELEKADVDKAILAAIPDEAVTLHRLLGFRPNSLQLKHDQERPLHCDLLLIDEVSMVDLPMMARLLRALPEEASLILVGDVKQLPSVDTGCVLADLVGKTPDVYNAETAGRIKKLSNQVVPVAQTDTFDYVTLLAKSHRFGSGGGISNIAKLVAAGEEKKSWKILQHHQQNQISFAHPEEVQLSYLDDGKLVEWLQNASDHYFSQINKADSLAHAFSAAAAFRILVPTRHGERGVVRLNQIIEQHLAAKSSQIRPGLNYPGRLLMVTENDYGIGLFNGDVGLIWPDEAGKLKAWFELGGGSYRPINISRLPAVETVYAMTIHKTQGSEFGQVALLLSQKPHPLLSRELVYTAITRAKKHLYVLTSEGVWCSAVGTRVQRYSGLQAKLFGDQEAIPE